MTEMIRRVQGVHAAIGSSLAGFGGFLRCERCGHQDDTLTAAAIGDYTAHGWPTCCGPTMMWWTQRQIDAGEVPDLA